MQLLFGPKTKQIIEKIKIDSIFFWTSRNHKNCLITKWNFSVKIPLEERRFQLKMISKKYFIISVSVTYAILIGLFLKFFLPTNPYDSSCYKEKTCVKFCCDDEKLCNQDFIEKHFDASLLENDNQIGWNISQGIKASFGEPDCDMEALEPEQEWRFTASVSCK